MFAAALTITATMVSNGPQHAVVLLVDDLGYGDTHHMGAEYPTPNIDALALGGIILNQSYSLQLCSPTRASLLSSRYPYNIGMDGSVLIDGDAKCITANMSTIGNQLQRNGVQTAFIGKYDVGYSSWACTANCRGFDYWLGYYGAAEDYYQHGSANSLDFHENFEQAPNYRGEYSTDLFTRKAIEWTTNVTSASKQGKTLLYLAFQAVHGPIEPPSGTYSGCENITEKTRYTYCLMMQALDAGIANLTAAYKTAGLFDDTVFLFLGDNGGMNADGGFNIPLRGQKATVWEGGVRSHTFLHWSGFSDSMKGTVYSGLAHVVDWGVTLTAALGYVAQNDTSTSTVNGEPIPPLDGMNLWPALVSGGASPRTEMLLSMRDDTECAAPYPDCAYRGQLAYRKGAYKLIYGHPALRGSQGAECAWSTAASASASKLLEGTEVGLDAGGLNCWNGWGVPKDRGPSRAPPTVPQQPGQPANTSGYQYGALFLFNIELDPTEETNLAASMPDKVEELLAILKVYNASQIDQSTLPTKGAVTTEKCSGSDGNVLKCAVPWLKPSNPAEQCSFPPPQPGPGPSPPGPPSPSPPPHKQLMSHLTESKNWRVKKKTLYLQGWACYLGDTPPFITLQVDTAAPVHTVAIAGKDKPSAPCGANGGVMATFSVTLDAARGVDFNRGKHTVTGQVTQAGGGGTPSPMGDSPGCIMNGSPVAC